MTNQKGGQGKTTATVTLAAEFATRGYTVRVIDCDPQLASATYWLPPQWGDVDPADRPTLLDALMGRAGLDGATYPTTVPNLWIVPSYTDVTQFDANRPPGADVALAQAIDEAAPFDVTIIDCPPNLGQLTVSAVTAGQLIVIPLVAGSLDHVGVADLTQTMTLIRKRLNPTMRVAAIVLRWQRYTRLGKQIEDQLMADFPDAVHQRIRETVLVKEAPSDHQPIQTYAPGSTTGQDFAALADQMEDQAQAAAR